MVQDRRYNEAEVAEIFELAASAPDSGRPLTGSDGLTLAQLQEIGREIGVAPARIAEAAATLDGRRVAPPRQKAFGMPIGVGRVVDLPRAPTDHEWGLLVTNLREVFQAQGREESRGNLRQWTNGNLHALIEPTDTGFRLRLGTVKSDAVALNNIGAVTGALGLMFVIVLSPLGMLAENLMIPGLLGGLAAAAFGYNALSLPDWARWREEQFEYIAQRAQALIAMPTTDSVRGSLSDPQTRNQDR